MHNKCTLKMQNETHNNLYMQFQESANARSGKFCNFIQLNLTSIMQEQRKMYFAYGG